MYGTFPRVIRKYVREENLLSLEEAIRKMTSKLISRKPGKVIKKDFQKGSHKQSNKNWDSAKGDNYDPF